MNPRAKSTLRTVVGITAAIIGGLLAKMNAEEGFDKLDRMVSRKTEQIEDPLTPPPPADPYEPPPLNEPELG